jgi:Arc/MetJ-type ribon-helix-helix transcriptional regulator
MTVQLVTRVPDEVVEVIDDLIREGVFASRSDAVRAGLGAIVDRRRRDAVGQAIVDGYRRVPPTEDEMPWPDTATAAMIAEEPW